MTNSLDDINRQRAIEACRRAIDKNKTNADIQIDKLQGKLASVERRLDEMKQLLSPKFTRKILQRYRHLDRRVLPMQQRYLAFEEILVYLKGANISDRKVREFVDAWRWCNDTWSDDDWRSTINLCLDDVLGAIVQSYKTRGIRYGIWDADKRKQKN